MTSQHGPELNLQLGDLIVALWDAFLEEYHDEELAMLATATVIQERVSIPSLETDEAEAA